MRQGSLSVPFEKQSEVLLHVAEVIASSSELGALLHDLPILVRDIVEFNCLLVTLKDPVDGGMRTEVLETPTSLGEDGVRLLSGERSPVDWIFQNQQPICCGVHELQFRFSWASRTLSQQGIASVCFLPLTTERDCLGVLVLGRAVPGGYDGCDLKVLLHVCKLVAAVVDSDRQLEHLRTEESKLARECDELRTLLEINNALVSKLELHELLPVISSCIRRVLRNEFTTLYIYEPENKALRLHALDIPGGVGLIREGLLLPLEGSPTGKAFTTRTIFTLTDFQLTREPKLFHPKILDLLIKEGVRAVCCVPLIRRGVVLGTLNVLTKQKSNFTSTALAFLEQIGAQVAIAVENALNYKQLSKLNAKLTSEKLYLEEENRRSDHFAEIVGESAALRRVLELVQTVSNSDATVLLLGETGTGKELIARAIHTLSDRYQRTFVKVNCAAIPASLLESELFGHERGAFTGAVAQKIGRFELANEGTLFLDEVGELPLELQPKLLRLVQEREFERLGGNRTIHVNVRLIAATNQDLHQMVADRRFRSDLYYRLNVFPIVLPPLRERRDDIPLLVQHFAAKYAHIMNRNIETIPTESMVALTHAEWPGNIRELENVIERAVILTRGSALNVPLVELEPTSKSAEVAAGRPPATKSDERAQIIQVLRDTNGIIGGLWGAAARLGLKRTTLLSRMQRLGIVSSKNRGQLKPHSARVDERQHILRTLRETNWLVSGPRGAAVRLDMKRTTLLSRMERLGISREKGEFSAELRN